MRVTPTTPLSSAESLARDIALLDRIAREDKGAFEAFYRNYFPRLGRFLERITRHPALIEEVINDTMLVVWQKAATYNHSCQVSTWLFAIAYRKALQALRRVDVPSHAIAAESVEPAQTGPEASLSRQQLRAAVRQTMAELSIEHRAVIELTYYHGYACREIAAIMDCPVDTVKTRMFYARRHLKTLLGAQAEDSEWLDE